MVNKYGLELTDAKHPLLVKEASFQYDVTKMSSPDKIVIQLFVQYEYIFA